MCRTQDLCSSLGRVREQRGLQPALPSLVCREGLGVVLLEKGTHVSSCSHIRTAEPW